MHQVTYFNLVQLKKNETIQWLQQLQQSQQNEIIILAVGKLWQVIEKMMPRFVGKKGII